MVCPPKRNPVVMLDWTENKGGKSWSRNHILRSRESDDLVTTSEICSHSVYECEMKVCIYSRVSTGEQDTTNQTVVLTDLAKRRGFEVAGIY